MKTKHLYNKLIQILCIVFNGLKMHGHVRCIYISAEHIHVKYSKLKYIIPHNHIQTSVVE